MRFLALLSLATFVSAAAVPEADANAIPTNNNNNQCKYPDPRELLVAKGTFQYAQLVPKQKSQFRANSDGTNPKNLIPEFNPTATVAITFRKSGKKVLYGNVLKNDETMDMPQGPIVQFTAEKNYDPFKTKYHVFLLDPDVPCKSASLPGSYLHDSFYDAQPECVTNQVRKKYTPIFQDPSPPSRERHRYTYLVYRQPKNYVPVPPTQVNGPAFDINAFVAANKLEGPVAGNFFQQGVCDNGRIDGIPVTDAICQTLPKCPISK